ncbi:heavy metal-associated domain-containing protein, partial [Streptomyces sp. NPDC087512]|uniref:heavy metal-associated domain-containing protein n=1 Tax=Streptomyces sp. NPDC087512 TaxID=3155059 RepID=UPI003430F640
MATTVPDTAEVELAIGGMTCASCAARIEKRLNRLEGVSATVNYATEKARVSFSGGVSVPELIATVEATGYTAREPEPAGARSAGSGAAGGEAERDGLAGLRQRLVTAVVLTVPVIAMAMVPALQF